VKIIASDFLFHPTFVCVNNYKSFVDFIFWRAKIPMCEELQVIFVLWSAIVHMVQMIASHVIF